MEIAEKIALFTDVEKLVCVICREILLEPVTLPCKHTACRICLDKTLDSNKFQCFLCRKFIGSWYRNAKRRNQLVNEPLWREIQETYPDLIEKKKNGESTDLIPFICTTKLSTPGEIKQEFEAFILQLRNEIDVERQKEDELNEKFIKQIEEEEKQSKLQEEELLKTDELIARELEAVSRHEKENIDLQIMSDEKLAKTLAANDKTIVLTSNDNTDVASNRLFHNFPEFSPKKRNASPISRRAKKKNFGPMDRFLCK